MPITIKHITPPQELSHYVHRFWKVITTDKTSYRVLPDGSWDFVLHVSPNTYQLEFVGPMTKAFVIPLDPRVLHYGVRFLPGTYFRPLKEDLSSFVNRSIPLHQFIKDKSFNADKPILPQLSMLVQELRIQELFMRKDKVDKALALFSNQNNLNIPLHELFQKYNLNLRTLERNFQHFVGLRPKQLVRINRQLSVAGSLLLKKDTLANLAAEFNYVDQAHMAKDIRFLSGTTPGGLQNEFDDFLQDEWPFIKDNT